MRDRLGGMWDARERVLRDRIEARAHQQKAMGMGMDERNSKASELEAWWIEQANQEIYATVAKAVEYGSGDLVEIGRMMARTAGRTGPANAGEITELGIFFYAYGKMARWAEAIREGRPVSADTLFDLGVYVRMAQRARQAGGWPDADGGAR